MNPEGWRELKSIVATALDLPSTDRIRWLEGIRIENTEVATEARRLILQSLQEDRRLATTIAAPDRVPGPYLSEPALLIEKRFEIREFLGAGGMGRVYSAFDKERGELVALKLLRAEYSDQAAYISRLKKEVQIASRLNHPNLCRVHDIHRVQTADGADTAVLTMELLHGETLSHRIQKCPLYWREALGILKQLVAGLAAAHQASILHRDLKSGNVMFVGGDTPRVVITDFGLAREIEGSPDTCSVFGPNAVVGTPAYMAPEQLRGEGASKSTDIYSLGVVAFEMVTGRLPFEGDSALAIALRRLKTEAPSARQITPSLPLSWDVAIRSCLASDAKNRPGSAEQFLRSVEEDPRFIAYWSRRYGRRAALAAIGAAACGGVSYFVPRTVDHPSQAVFHFQRGKEFLRRGRGEDLRNAIDEFNQSIKIDSHYPEALASLAAAYCLSAHYDFLEPAEAKAGADNAAQHALQLDRRSALALGAVAYIRSIDFNHWRQAEPIFKQAISANPNEPLPHAWYAAYLGRLAHFRDAVLEARKAVELDSGSFYNNHQLAYEYFRSRNFKMFYKQSQELLHLQSTEASAFLSMARACEWLQRYDEGLHYCDQAELYGSKTAAACYRGLIEAARGNNKVAERLAEQVEDYGRTQPFEASVLVNLYARLGQFDHAMDILDRALERQDSTVLACPTSIYLDSMRSMPRYRTFLRKLGFNPDALTFPT